MKKLMIAAFVIITLSLPLIVTAQPHPNGGNIPNGGGTQNDPVGAPVGSGTLILTLLASAYGGKKMYILNHKCKE